MTNDEEWVADVRRWVAAGPVVRAAAPASDDTEAVGYEAAHPSLQAPHWPDDSRFGRESAY